MNIRNLELKDAALMLEWMHDDSIISYLSSDFKSKTIDDCIKFIKSVNRMENQLHLAVTDDFDNYMGTVSLKNIDNGIAEFAITVRSVAQGKGYAEYGMKQILNKAFNDLNLNKVYWYVSSLNIRALRFYEKMGFSPTTQPVFIEPNKNESLEPYQWYCIQKDKN